jgi:hypothetical protein
MATKSGMFPKQMEEATSKVEMPTGKMELITPRGDMPIQKMNQGVGKGEMFARKMEDEAPRSEAMGRSKTEKKGSKSVIDQAPPTKPQVFALPGQDVSRGDR